MKYVLMLVSLMLLSCSPKSPTSQNIKIDQTANLSSQDSTVNFGTLNYKQSVLKTIQIINDLSASTSAPVSPVIAEPNSSNYSIVYKNNCDKILKPQEKCTVKVQLTNNSQGGSLNAELIADSLMINLTAQAESVSGNDLAFVLNQQTITEISFGQVVKDPVIKTIAVVNKSKIPTSLGEVSLNNSDFEKLQDDCSNKILQTGKECRIKMLFSPQGKQDQIYSATLSVNSMNLNLSATLSGGVSSNPIYDLAFSEKGLEVSGVNFGNLTSQATRTVFVKNIGNTVVSNLNPQVLNNKFQIPYSSCGTFVAPQKACSLKILFNPAGRDSGVYNDTLSIGGETLSLEAVNQPILQSASLSGPMERLSEGTYYTKEELGQEILLQINAIANGSANSSLTPKVSLNSDCSSSEPVGVFQLEDNQINDLFVHVVDGNNISSTCLPLGKIYKDTVPPQVVVNTAGGNQNLTGVSAILPVSFSSSDLYRYKYSYQVYSSQNCNTGGGITAENLDLLSNNTISLNLTNQQYSSIKIIARDIANNQTEICSPNYIYGLPTQLSVTLPSPLKVYESDQSYTGTLLDITGAAVVNSPVTISQGSESITVNTDSSGVFTFKLSSNNDLSQSDTLNLNYNDSASAEINQFVVTAQANQTVLNNYPYQVIRRSCQEYALYDQASVNAVLPVDVDLEGLIAPEGTIECDFATGKDYEVATYSVISGRAKVTKSLRSFMGIERIKVPTITLATGETATVPVGASVYRPTVEDSRIRFVGNWSASNDYDGKRISAGSDNSYIEVVFYGTGLNYLTEIINGAFDTRVSIDGASEIATNFYINGNNTLIQRGYDTNQIVNIASGLPLGWHIAKIRRASGILTVYGFEIINDTTNILVPNGGVISQNELNGITLPSISNYKEGVTEPYGARVVKYVHNNQLMSAQTPVDSGLEQAINGTFNDSLDNWTAVGAAWTWNNGTAQNSAGTTYTQLTQVKTDWEVGKVYLLTASYVKASAADTRPAFIRLYESSVIKAQSYSVNKEDTLKVYYVPTSTTATIALAYDKTAANTINFDNLSIKKIKTLADTDHTNEDVARTYNFRDFKSNTGRSDDFGTVAGTHVDRAFTLEDNSTHLTGAASSRIYTTTNGVETVMADALNAYHTIHFVGTGLDIYVGGQDTGTTNVFDSHSVILDDQVNLGNIFESTVPRTIKIVSGLPYGSHTIKITRTQLIQHSLHIANFIVYQPKQPVIPSNSTIVADYNVLAKHIGHTNDYAGIGPALGVIRKGISREWVFSVGTSAGGWSMATGDRTISGFSVTTNNLNATAMYNFWGTGFDFKWYAASNRSSTINVTLNGIPLTSANFPGVKCHVVSPGGDVGFNLTTGVLDGSSSTVSYPGFVCRNLPLGRYTLRIINGTSGTNGYIVMNGIDIITPIHSYNMSINP